jgi:hypothetical protein
MAGILPISEQPKVLGLMIAANCLAIAQKMNTHFTSKHSKAFGEMRCNYYYSIYVLKDEFLVFLIPQQDFLNLLWLHSLASPNHSILCQSLILNFV